MSARSRGRRWSLPSCVQRWPSIRPQVAPGRRRACHHLSLRETEIFSHPLAIREKEKDVTRAETEARIDAPLMLSEARVPNARHRRSTGRATRPWPCQSALEELVHGSGTKLPETCVKVYWTA